MVVKGEENKPFEINLTGLDKNSLSLFHAQNSSNIAPVNKSNNFNALANHDMVPRDLMLCFYVFMLALGMF